MYEVEIKVPAALERVRDRLRERDADPAEIRRQRDVYYDAPHREFAETDEALRIRRETVIEDPATDGGGSAGGAPADPPPSVAGSSITVSRRIRSASSVSANSRWGAS